jgi:hypothetical protein
MHPLMKNSNTKKDASAGCMKRLVRRGPVETTTGMIRVKVDVQQESDDYWVARVQGSAPKCYAGQTRKEAIRLALNGASIPPNAPALAQSGGEKTTTKESNQ